MKDLPEIDAPLKSITIGVVFDYFFVSHFFAKICPRIVIIIRKAPAKNGRQKMLILFLPRYPLTLITLKSILIDFLRNNFDFHFSAFK